MGTLRRCLLGVLVALVGAGCASGSGSGGASAGQPAATEAASRDDGKLEKVWVADGFRLQGADTLYIGDTRTEVANLNPDGKENLEWARGVVRDEVAAAIRAKGLFGSVVTREADIKAGSQVLTLEQTIIEYERGGGAARYFAGLYGAGQPVIKVRGQMSGARQPVLRFEARRSGVGGKARWLGGVMDDKEIQTRDIRDFAEALADFLAQRVRR